MSNTSKTRRVVGVVERRTVTKFFVSTDRRSEWFWNDQFVSEDVFGVVVKEG